MQVTKRKDVIPAEVLALLKARWQHEEGFSLFEAICAGRSDRVTRPAWYCHRPKGEASMLSPGSLTGDEAIALHKTGAFDGNSFSRPSGNVLVNEHAEHALYDFLGEVYAAWDKYHGRLDKLPYAEPEAA